ncbi:hypothetical protein [Streptomyces sp. SP17KL33]|uniref:hypothetical protein n=1 Tax=Streptomyces sp. SP17KL33 TaxID=3002534 RepID=UPI002E77C7FC|nr:hypothetical protein [Streptomyces sp. SP17KL33]MEE1833856.1 hypothetical protein [Streptomyces sp. SP17KL33]
MTALPGAGAVLRVARGAAGCRPVRVALLVGGLFVLGVLCGERASAADGAPTSPPLLTTVTQHVTQQVTQHVARPATERAARPVSEQAARPVTEVTEVAESVVRPVTESVVEPVAESVVVPVTEGVVVPVGDLVESVTEGLGGVTSQLPPVSLPSLPGVPGLPEVPELPELPGGTTLPVESLPTPAGVVPQESGPTEAERPGPVSDGAGGRDAGRATGPTSVAVAYGPKVVVGGPAIVRAPAPAAADGDNGGAPSARVPAQQNPDGLPTGTLGRHSAVDNHGPRHSEPHAVAALPSAPMSLVPGAPVADAAYGTRDRHRDIPEFPG